MAVTGEPVMVNMCHCTECQRRSGVPLTVNAYFNEVDVKIEGEHKTYSRAGASGGKLHNYFCPICGAAATVGNHGSFHTRCCCGWDQGRTDLDGF